MLFQELKVGYKLILRQMTILRTVAKEVRQEIFENSLVVHLATDPYHQNTTHKTPPFLVALRGQKDLYQEALYVFYKINRFYYHRSTQNFNGFCNQECGQLGGWKNIRHLGIDLMNGSSGHFVASPKTAYDFLYFISEPTTVDIPTFGRQVANNLETLDINASHGNTYSFILRMLGPHLTKLKRFSLNVLNRSDADFDLEYAKAMPQLVRISHLFGVKSRRELGPHDDTYSLDRFVWEAKEGNFLKQSEYISWNCEELHDGPCERKEVD